MYLKRNLHSKSGKAEGSENQIKASIEKQQKSFFIDFSFIAFSYQYN